VSHDRGATWSQQPLPDTGAGVEVTPPGASTDANVIALTTSIMIYPLASRDGVTAYVSVHDESAAQPAQKLPGLEDLWYARTFRTTDGGLTWREVDTAAVTPSHSAAWMTADHRLVLGVPRPVGNGYQMVFAVSGDGRTYTVETPPGLPPTISEIDGSVAYNADSVYVSDDGWTWREVGAR
jgi:hypothetical protein